MQTFLPYPDFEASAAVLDQARLGKQRVETLQILRALVLPDYGWRSHPVTRMWMGYVPALTVYGLAMVREWVSRGHADSTAPLISEFAPDTAAAYLAGSGPEPAMPPWLGNAEVHVSHQSNLIQKAPEFYRDRFPGTPDDLPYNWPEPEEELIPVEPLGERLWIWHGPLDTDHGDALQLPAHPPAGRAVPKWTRQYTAFTELAREGDPAGVVVEGGARLQVGTLGPLALDPVEPENDDDDAAPPPTARRPIALSGWLRRTDFEYPALLQDPRRFYAVELPGTLAQASGR
ncbi:hypothetical protein GC088_03835 [Arthrobacter sp. JZ12]|uniref:MSMEG_6728 family protein n=1 Tax=Arthrobacter sp. JZ12 TaxID=2654190 RepID=UPI002B4A6118|nr:MSMEG_6728 family protein [Arthrobacter sp. JZ12]WRH24307.1 hypothetical protein GC088_03835 [Arthrobacter sp. JZ12]